jgi:hypothetical protein
MEAFVDRGKEEICKQRDGSRNDYQKEKEEEVKGEVNSQQRNNCC